MGKSEFVMFRGCGTNQRRQENEDGPITFTVKSACFPKSKTQPW